MKIITAFSLFVTLFFAGCSDYPTDPATIPYDFSTGVKLLLDNYISAGVFFRSPNITAIGIRELTNDVVDSLDGFILTFIQPDGVNGRFYTEKINAPKTFSTGLMTDGSYQLTSKFDFSFNDIYMVKFNDVMPRYQLHNSNYDSTYNYGDLITWKINSSDTEFALDTFRLMNDLYPMALNGNSPPSFIYDTLSISKGVTISWGSPDTSSRVIINLYYSSMELAAYIRLGVNIMDTGSYTLTTDDFTRAKIMIGEQWTFHVIRYKVTNNYYDSFGKRIAAMTFTHAGIGAVLVP
ncbi:MAG: hypothetical protein QG635_2050 [Bacteroidota bacterium]|nr:hypothetical protein [Bacteroidota bacterium]